MESVQCAIRSALFLGKEIKQNESAFFTTIVDTTLERLEKIGIDKNERCEAHFEKMVRDYIHKIRSSPDVLQVLQSENVVVTVRFQGDCSPGSKVYIFAALGNVQGDIRGQCRSFLEEMRIGHFTVPPKQKNISVPPTKKIHNTKIEPVKEALHDFITSNNAFPSYEEFLQYCRDSLKTSLSPISDADLFTVYEELVRKCILEKEEYVKKTFVTDPVLAVQFFKELVNNSVEDIRFSQTVARLLFFFNNLRFDVELKLQIEHSVKNMIVKIFQQEMHALAGDNNILHWYKNYKIVKKNMEKREIIYRNFAGLSEILQQLLASGAVKEAQEIAHEILALIPEMVPNSIKNKIQLDHLDGKKSEALKCEAETALRYSSEKLAPTPPETPREEIAVPVESVIPEPDPGLGLEDSKGVGLAESPPLGTETSTPTLPESVENATPKNAEPPTPAAQQKPAPIHPKTVKKAKESYEDLPHITMLLEFLAFMKESSPNKNEFEGLTIADIEGLKKDALKKMERARDFLTQPFLKPSVINGVPFFIRGRPLTPSEKQSSFFCGSLIFKRENGEEQEMPFSVRKNTWALEIDGTITMDDLLESEGAQLQYFGEILKYEVFKNLQAISCRAPDNYPSQNDSARFFGPRKESGGGNYLRDPDQKLITPSDTTHPESNVPMQSCRTVLKHLRVLPIGQQPSVEKREEARDLGYGDITNPKKQRNILYENHGLESLVKKAEDREVDIKREKRMIALLEPDTPLAVQNFIRAKIAIKLARSGLIHFTVAGNSSSDQEIQYRM
ncbi:MAG: hypothetical protein WCJ84_01025 [Candidatus Peregrinibacteria bacterium]